MSNVKVKNLFRFPLKSSDYVEIVDINDDVDPWYGINKMVITEEQINQLKNGKVIYFSDGEYASVVALDKVVKKIEDSD